MAKIRSAVSRRAHAADVSEEIRDESLRTGCAPNFRGHCCGAQSQESNFCASRTTAAYHSPKCNWGWVVHEPNRIEGVKIPLTHFEVCNRAVSCSSSRRTASSIADDTLWAWQTQSKREFILRSLSGRSPVSPGQVASLALHGEGRIERTGSRRSRTVPESGC